jgi:hypothetical protein
MSRYVDLRTRGRTCARFLVTCLMAIGNCAARVFGGAAESSGSATAGGSGGRRDFLVPMFVLGAVAVLVARIPSSVVASAHGSADSKTISISLTAGVGTGGVPACWASSKCA